MNREEWLAKRRLGVSGSDISVLMGVNKYKTVDDLVLDKLGVGKSFEGNIFTRVGVRLESHVANCWAKREQRILISGEFNCSPKNDRYIGTTDFETGHNEILEIKTGGWKTWKNGMPKMYEFQLRWYLMIRERPAGHLVACIVPDNRREVPDEDADYMMEWVANRPSREFLLERDQSWEEEASHLADEFLERIERLRNPATQG